jgi:RNA polymerase-binding transcription factor DksA
MTTHPLPTAGAELDPVLVEAAAVRHEQLQDLPDAEGDPVVAAQRSALQQTLAEIAAARRRIVDGTFGACTGCGRSIPVERLELRPWAGTCVACGKG